jgi:hypothetical protein
MEKYVVVFEIIVFFMLLYILKLCKDILDIFEEKKS